MLSLLVHSISGRKPLAQTTCGHAKTVVRLLPFAAHALWDNKAEAQLPAARDAAASKGQVLRGRGLMAIGRRRRGGTRGERVALAAGSRLLGLGGFSAKRGPWEFELVAGMREKILDLGCRDKLCYLR